MDHLATNGGAGLPGDGLRGRSPLLTGPMVLLLITSLGAMASFYLLLSAVLGVCLLRGAGMGLVVVTGAAVAGRDPQCIHSIERENLMGSTLLNMTVSLDGFGAGEHIDVEHPLGVGGERLHDWIFTAGGDRSVTAGGTSPGGVDAQVMRELAETTGAVLIGRRTFDVGLGHWQDTPYPLPCVVLTHETRSPMAMTSASFTFVTSGIADAVEQARKFAGEKNVLIMGGADVGQQALRAGLVDEIQIQLVPVLIGAGTRLFDHLGTDRIELERTRTIESPYVTHLRFRVVG